MLPADNEIVSEDILILLPDKSDSPSDTTSVSRGGENKSPDTRALSGDNEYLSGDRPLLSTDTGQLSCDSVLLSEDGIVLSRDKIPLSAAKIMEKTSKPQ